MKLAKKLLCLCLLFVVFCVACESDGLKTAYLNDATNGLSTNYAIKVVLSEDERVNDRYVDLQVRSDKAGQIISFGEEGSDKVDIVFENADDWYNITVLLNKANDKSGEEIYEKYSEKGNKTYLFTSNSDVNLTFRVVVGNVTDNDEKTGQLLTSVESVSDELEINVKAAK